MGKIVWIASYPKSGNTWTRAFLLNLFMNPRKHIPLDEMARMSPLDAALYWFNEASGEERESYTKEEAAGLRVAAQRKLAAYLPQTGFVKTHCAFVPWHGHPTFDLALTAGAVYIVRNPLDIVGSYAAHSGHRLDHIIKIMGEHDHATPGSETQVPQILGSWNQNVVSWTGRPNRALHVMRYEDMVTAPTETFAGLAHFLQVNPPAERLERAVEFSSFDSLRRIESAEGFSEKTKHQSTFFRSGRTGGWREELTRDQIERVVDACRDQMARFGYLPEGM